MVKKFPRSNVPKIHGAVLEVVRGKLKGTAQNGTLMSATLTVVFTLQHPSLGYIRYIKSGTGELLLYWAWREVKSVRFFSIV